MLQTGIINDHLQQILVTVNSCIIFNFQVKVLRNPASIERHTGAGGKGGKITKLLLCINLIFKGKYPPPPSALRGHVPGIHRGNKPSPVKARLKLPTVAQVHSTSKKLLYQLDHLVQLTNQSPNESPQKKHVSQSLGKRAQSPLQTPSSHFAPCYQMQACC